MKITEISESVRAMTPGQFPQDQRPEIAFVGRSNVGKSSLLNSLVNRRKLAATSGTPGKTRSIFFYLVNNAFYLVDLPGYGYAKVSREMRKSWAPLIEDYLHGRSQLLLLIHLVDFRHSPTAEDEQMSSWINHHRLPYVVAATKADKISRGRRRQHLKMLREGLNLSSSQLIIPFSSKTGEGREELQKFIRGTLGSVGVKV